MNDDNEGHNWSQETKNTGGNVVLSTLKSPPSPSPSPSPPPPLPMSLVHAKVKENYRNFKDISDRDTVLALIKDHPHGLQFVKDDFKNDDEIVRSAVISCPSALEFASSRCRDSTELVLMAIQTKAVCITYVSPRLWNDRVFVLQALMANPTSVTYLTNIEYLNDPEIILVALRSYGADCREFWNYEMSIPIRSRLEALIKRIGGVSESTIDQESREEPQSASPVSQTEPPNPPQSAFVCFRDTKKGEIWKKYGISKDNNDTFKEYAAEWKKLTGKERAYWDEVARNDKIRFVREKAAYNGPYKFPQRRAKRAPLAPKRPLPAFLTYSKSRRARVREDNPDMTNTDVSRLLGEMWRNGSMEERLPYLRMQEVERFIYNTKVARWRIDGGTNFGSNTPNTKESCQKEKDVFAEFVFSSTRVNQNKRKRCDADGGDGNGNGDGNENCCIISNDGAQTSSRRNIVFAATEWQRRKWERIWLIGCMGTKERRLPSNVPKKIIEYANFQYRKEDYEELVVFEPLINKMIELKLDLGQL